MFNCQNKPVIVFWLVFAGCLLSELFISGTDIYFIDNINKIIDNRGVNQYQANIAFCEKFNNSNACVLADPCYWDDVVIKGIYIRSECSVIISKQTGLMVLMIFWCLYFSIIWFMMLVFLCVYFINKNDWGDQHHQLLADQLSYWDVHIVFQLSSAFELAYMLSAVSEYLLPIAVILLRILILTLQPISKYAVNYRRVVPLNPIPRQNNNVPQEHKEPPAPRHRDNKQKFQGQAYQLPRPEGAVNKEKHSPINIQLNVNIAEQLPRRQHNNLVNGNDNDNDNYNIINQGKDPIERPSNPSPKILPPESKSIKDPSSMELSKVITVEQEIEGKENLDLPD